MDCLMYSIPDNDFLALIRRCTSVKQVAEALGYNNCAGQTNILFHQRCKELGIDWRRELRGNNYQKVKRTPDNVFCINSTVDQGTLRRWFLEGEYTPYKCSICGVSSWNGDSLTLRLDHINGHNKDNRVSNLRWLCPNCDSQQSTYCGRNLSYKAPKKHCLMCGAELRGRKPSYCWECYLKIRKTQRKVERPKKEELFEMLKESNFSKVGERFGVTDNAVRKWCKDYGLPTHYSDYHGKKIKREKKDKIVLPCTAVNLQNKVVKKFRSTCEASKWVCEQNLSRSYKSARNHISEVCKGKRETAYGYKWSFL